MTAKLLIYGAAGYTGRLISERARQAGLEFEIAGRNEAKVAALAHELGVPFRIFGVENAAALRTGLEGVAALLNYTVNGYSYTPLSAIEAARRVLAGEHRPGFQTPAMVFGAAFAESISDTSITDLAPCAA